MRITLPHSAISALQTFQGVVTRLLPYAVKHPLDEFWEKTDGGWVSPRGHQKIVSLRGKSDANRRAGTTGARAKWGGPAERSGETRYQRLKAARAIASHTDEQWSAMLAVCEDRCVRCGAADQRLVKDHVTPLYQGRF